MRFVLFVFILFLVCSCRIHNINSDFEKVLNRYEDRYTMYLENQRIDAYTTYLDKENIRNIKIDTKNKTLRITQHKKRKAIALEELNYKNVTLSVKHNALNTSEIRLVVVNGIPLDVSTAQLRFELDIIDTLHVVSKSIAFRNLTYCSGGNDTFFVITTK